MNIYVFVELVARMRAAQHYRDCAWREETMSSRHAALEAALDMELRVDATLAEIAEDERTPLFRPGD